ncbi:MAG: TolC family protein [Lautropia sp.]|nr:TolC family protein [Lautropia sp.]
MSAASGRCVVGGVLLSLLLAACAPIQIASTSSVRLPERFEQTERHGQGKSGAPGGSPGQNEASGSSRPGGQIESGGQTETNGRTEAGGDNEPGWVTDPGDRSGPGGQSGTGGLSGSGMQPVELSRWWRDWREPVLQQLIVQGMARNRSLAAMAASRQAAQAQAALADADRGPQVAFDARTIGVGDQDNPLPPALRAAAAGAGMPAAAQANFNRPHYRGMGFSASWEPDIFGRKRSDADAVRQVALIEAERWHGAQLLLAADIADHYLQVRALQIRIRQGEARLASLQQLLQHARARFRAGQVRAIEVREAETACRSAQAELATLGARVAAHVRSLAVLTGQTPQTFSLAASPVDVFEVLPAAPTGQHPLEVLMRRPDVRAQERSVQAYSARLASAKADRLPRVDISFLWQYGRIGLDTSLPGIGSTSGLANASVSVPIFTAGRIGHNIDRADAELRAALARYDQSLLDALAEVDSSYQLQYGLHRQNGLLAEAASQSRRRADDALRLFRWGDLTLDQALRARLQAQQLDERYTQGRLAEARNLLNLYKALGGGWSANQEGDPGSPGKPGF